MFTELNLHPFAIKVHYMVSFNATYRLIHIYLLPFLQRENLNASEIAMTHKKIHAFIFVDLTMGFNYTFIIIQKLLGVFHVIYLHFFAEYLMCNTRVLDNPTGHLS